MKKFVLILVLILNFQFLIPSARAGGPFFVDLDGSGEEITWKDDNLKWVVDAGPLSSKIGNSKAIQWVYELFRIWQDAGLETSSGEKIRVADLTIEYDGVLDRDINNKNYHDFILWDEPVAVVIFDTTGEIVDEELGAGSRDYIVGFASPFISGDSKYFVGGVVVINGLFIDGDSKASGELNENAFKAAILHEMGHLLNLDHTQANIEAVYRVLEGDDSLTDEIPTMFPVLYTEDQLKLHADDIIALAEQYPTPEYTEEFCRISGELVDAEGGGFQGADIVARALSSTNEWSDIRTIISGVAYPAGTANGDYALGGILPGREYIIGYREVPSLFTGGSNIAPFDPPRAGFGSADIGVASCSRKGEDVQIETKNAVSTAPIEEHENDGPDTNEVAAPAGGCSLIPHLK